MLTFLNSIAVYLNTMIPQTTNESSTEFYKIMFPAESNTLIVGIILYAIIMVIYFLFIYLFSAGSEDPFGFLTIGDTIGTYTTKYMYLEYPQFIAILIMTLYTHIIGFAFIYLFLVVNFCSLIRLLIGRIRAGTFYPFVIAALLIISFLFTSFIFVSKVLYYDLSNSIGLTSFIGLALGLVAAATRLPYWSRLYQRYDMKGFQMGQYKGWGFVIASLMVGLPSCLFYYL